MLPTVKKTFEVTADSATMQRFENFLALMHFNGGHSGTFGMYFDGDGSDVLRVEPEPERSKSRHRISDSGYDVELATETGYTAYNLDRSRWYTSKDGNLIRCKKMEDGEVLKEVVK